MDGQGQKEKTRFSLDIFILHFVAFLVCQFYLLPQTFALCLFTTAHTVTCVVWMWSFILYSILGGPRVCFFGYFLLFGGACTLVCGGAARRHSDFCAFRFVLFALVHLSHFVSLVCCRVCLWPLPLRVNKTTAWHAFAGNRTAHVFVGLFAAALADIYPPAVACRYSDATPLFYVWDTLRFVVALAGVHVHGTVGVRYLSVLRLYKDSLHLLPPLPLNSARFAPQPCSLSNTGLSAAAPGEEEEEEQALSLSPCTLPVEVRGTGIPDSGDRQAPALYLSPLTSFKSGEQAVRQDRGKNHPYLPNQMPMFILLCLLKKNKQENNELTHEKEKNGFKLEGHGSYSVTLNYSVDSVGSG